MSYFPLQGGNMIEMKMIFANANEQAAILDPSWTTTS